MRSPVTARSLLLLVHTLTHNWGPLLEVLLLRDIVLVVLDVLQAVVYELLGHQGVINYEAPFFLFKGIYLLFLGLVLLFLGFQHFREVQELSLDCLGRCRF